MKKSFLVILILLCTKIISAQIIKDISSIPENLSISLSQGFKTNQVPDPIILEESNAGEYFFVNQSDTTRRDLIYSNVLKKFYAISSEQYYDFIVMCPTESMTAHYCAVLNRQIEGIGWKTKYPDAPNLDAVIAFDIYPLWKYGFPALYSSMLERVLIHEIAHYWLAFIKWDQHNEVAHWQYNLDLFNGDTRYADPMSYYHWILKDGQEFCVDGNTEIISKFSDLSLYLMGLLSPEQVSPIYEHVFEPKPGNTHYNDWGPSCEEQHKFTETRTITIQDIINANGVRNPSCEKSRKNYSIKFIIVAEKGEEVPSGFIEYVKKYMEALPEAWNRLTSNKSNIGFLETPKIVFNQPDINFGKVAAGNVKTEVLTISNGSSSPLIIDSIYTNTKWFTVNSEKITLTKADTLRLPVTFIPEAMKSYSDTLFIVSNSKLLFTPIALKGQLEVPRIVLNQNTIDFSSVNVNSISKDSLTITNNSFAPLIIDSVYTKSRWYNVKAQKDTIIDKDTLRLYIFFTPDTIKSYIDTLYIVNNSDVSLEKVLLVGNVELTGIVQNNSGIPDKFEISQNYPNPFNPITTINYQLSINSHIKLKVFDMLGNEIAVLINTYQTAGYYSLTFNAANLPSGVYLYRLETEFFSSTKKLVLLK